MSRESHESSRLKWFKPCSSLKLGRRLRCAASYKRSSKLPIGRPRIVPSEIQLDIQMHILFGYAPTRITHQLRWTDAVRARQSSWLRQAASQPASQPGSKAARQQGIPGCLYPSSRLGVQIFSGGGLQQRQKKKTLVLKSAQALLKPCSSLKLGHVVSCSRV